MVTPCARLSTSWIHKLPTPGAQCVEIDRQIYGLCPYLTLLPFEPSTRLPSRNI